jgi:dTDP-4-amino-4,6-dideoxygalactose transaminase
MNEFSAAMGLTSLESMEGFVGANRSNYEGYRERLRDVPGVRLLAYDDREKCNYQYVVAEIDASVTGLSRDDLVRVLWAENVNARRYFYPGCHEMEPYRSLYPDAGEKLPATEELAGRVLSLPTGTAVGPGEIAAICEVLEMAVARGPGIHQHILAGKSAASG